jgi:hypothetical protein
MKQILYFEMDLATVLGTKKKKKLIKKTQKGTKRNINARKEYKRQKTNLRIQTLEAKSI